jgi:hypothetical protein
VSQKYQGGSPGVITVCEQKVPADRDQPMMLPEDMRLWAGEDHFVWFLPWRWPAR